ncbi:MAG: cob(I)yrinic acid a,c-diamide adenosyltransferase [Bacteroidales bacterium]|nr:cob(I)yrinic acid a,c-diamide adenosyltransferase [Bacteroidales bacterium]
MGKVYTRTGDEGTTSLVGGSRVAKDDLRVEAYGTVDELTSLVGLVADQVRLLGVPAMAELYGWLKQTQQVLFVVQTVLATEDEAMLERLPQVAPGQVVALEERIDKLSQQLPPLKAFVLPGGPVAAAQCHVARTVCRRAERRVVSLRRTSEVPAEVGQYLNRLSDFLFVVARWIVVGTGGDENFWQAT